MINSGAIASSQRLASGGPTDTGWVFPSSVTSTGTGNKPWLNPSNATAKDAVYAHADNVDSEESTKYLTATNFGFSIPIGATIDGIEVRVKHYQDTGDNLYEHTFQLVTSGTGSGNNKAVTSANIPKTTPVEEIFGSSVDLWGLTDGVTITPAIINASDFGFHYRLYEDDRDDNHDAYVDSVEIKVHYTT